MKGKLVPGTLVHRKLDGSNLTRYVCWVDQTGDSMELVSLEAPIMIVSFSGKRRIRRNITLLGANGRIGYASSVDAIRWQEEEPS